MDVCELVGLPATDANYKAMFDRECFMVVAKKMFKENIKKSVTPKFLEALRNRMLTDRNPSLSIILGDLGGVLGSQTISNLKTDLNKGTFFDGITGKLADSFVVSYLTNAAKHYHDKEDKHVDKFDSVYSGHVKLTEQYTYTDIVDRVEGFKDVVFDVPEKVSASTEIDFDCETVQFIELSNYGSHTEQQQVFKYSYGCSKCDLLTPSYHKLSQSARCIHGECNGLLYEKREARVKRSLYGYFITYGQNPIPTLSFTKLPKGTFTAGMFARPNDDDKGFHFVVLGIKEKVYQKSNLQLEGSRHFVIELMDYIDQLHEEKLGYSIRGLHQQKAAFNLTTFANFCGSKSHNVLMAGRSATGKSLMLRYYLPTLALRSSFNDAGTTSKAGMVGSSDPAKINGQVTKMYSPGLFTQVQLIGLDEIYSNPKLYQELKTPLIHSEVTKQVSGTTINAPKVGTVFASANINTSYLASMREKFLRYKKEWEDDGLDHHNFRTFRGELGEIAYQKWVKYDDGDLCVKELILLEEKAAGRNHIDGEDISTLERYTFLFYMGEEGKQNPHDSKPSQKKKIRKQMTIEEIRSRVYTPSIEEEFQCASRRAEPEITPYIDSLLDDVYFKMIELDRIHTNERLSESLKEFAMYSAMLNNRTYVNEIDVLFIRDVFMATTRFMEPEQFRFKSYWNEPLTTAEARVLLTGSVDEPATSFEAVESVTDFIARKCEKYDLFGEGVPYWDRMVRNIELDVESKFEMKRCDAVKCVESFIANQGGVPSEVVEAQEAVEALLDQTIEHITVLPKSDVFKEPPSEATVEGVYNYISGELIRCKRIDVSKIKSIVSVHGIDHEIVSSSLNKLQSENKIAYADNVCVWTT